MKKFLYAVLIIVIIGLAVSDTILYKHTKEKISLQPQTQSIAQDRNAKIDSWTGLSGTELLLRASRENIWLEPEFGVSGTLLDITGDGIEEGIYGGNGGNNGISFILLKDKNDAISFAQAKDKNGDIRTISLLEVGRVMVQEKYELLPKEHGFYTVSLSYDEVKSADKDESIYKCNELKAYVWNPSTNLFEWNAMLTAKYTAQICK